MVVIVLVVVLPHRLRIHRLQFTAGIGAHCCTRVIQLGNRDTDAAPGQATCESGTTTAGNQRIDTVDRMRTFAVKLMKQLLFHRRSQS